MASSPTTIIYRISESIATVQKTRSDLIDNLLRAYDVEALPNWALDHRLFRELENEETSGGSPLTSASKLQHLLQLNLDGKLADDVYVVYECPASGPVEAAKVRWEDVFTTTISSSHFSSYSNLVSHKFQYQWLPRAAVYVPHGSAFRAGGRHCVFTVRVGEVIVRQHNTFRGVLVAISYQGDNPNASKARKDSMEVDGKNLEEEEAKFAKDMIDSFWQTLGFASRTVSRRDDGDGPKHGIELEKVVAWQWATSLKVRP